MSMAWDFGYILGTFGNSRKENQIIANLSLSEVLWVLLKDADKLVESCWNWIIQADQVAKQTASPVMIEEALADFSVLRKLEGRESDGFLHWKLVTRAKS